MQHHRHLCHALRSGDCRSDYPGIHELNIVDLPHILPYSPTLHEWMVTLSGFAFCGILFMMGERLFRGHLSEDH
jgi:hypothetical protein